MGKKSILCLVIWMVSLSAVWAAEPRLSVFVNIYGSAGLKAKISVKKVEIIGGNKAWVLPLRQRVISTELPFKQLLLATGEIPEGFYQGLKLYMEGAMLNEEPLDIPLPQIELPVSFEIKKGESKSIFIAWNVAESVEERRFMPRMSARLGGKPLPGENLFVFTDDTGTAWVITADKNQVVYSFGLGERPQGVAFDSEEGRIYVLCERERAIKVIGIRSFQIEDVIPVPLLVSPRFIALREDGTAMITSPRDRMLALMDLRRGSLVRSKRVGYTPQEVIYVSSVDRFLVSSPSDSAVYALDESLSEERLSSGFVPRGMAADDRFLYIADEMGGIHLYELERFRYQGRVDVCQHAERVLIADDRILVSCKEGILAIIIPGHWTATRRIRVGKGAFSLVYHSWRHWIYVSLRGEEALGVVDSSRERLVGQIPIGGKPFEMVVTP